MVGVSQALTGDKSEPGNAVQNGYLLWAKTVNDAGGLLGRRVEIKSYDNQSRAETAVTQYERLVTVDKVDLLLGPFSSALTSATAAVAEKYQMAFPEGAGGAPDLFTRGFKYLFFVQPATSDKAADPFVAWIMSLPADQRPKTAAYPQQDDPYTLALVGAVQQQFEAAGIKTVYRQVYPASQTDFASIAAAIKASGAEALIGGTVVNDAIGQVQAYIGIGYQPKVAFFTSGPGTVGPFKGALGDKVDGITTSLGWAQSAPTPGNPAFVAAWQKMYPNEQGIPDEGANGFAAASVLQKAVEGTKSLDNVKIAQWLHSNKVDTIEGTLGWDEAGRPTGQYLLQQYQKGALAVIGPPDVAKDTRGVYPKANW
ncbi:MAG: amino acid ABC transporter substrate-binding protein [Chloroflexi bacterium]|nr:amino acid ABC transporter substrate-binding protein [Chloroflexota bacterium]